EVVLRKIENQVLLGHGESRSVVRFSPGVDGSSAAGCRRAVGRGWLSLLFFRVWPWGSPSTLKKSHTEAPGSRRSQRSRSNVFSANFAPLRETSHWELVYQRFMHAGSGIRRHSFAARFHAVSQVIDAGCM